MNLSFITPTELLNEFTEETLKCRDDRFFNDPRFQKVREKWVAATLGLALVGLGKSVKVRIVEEKKDEADFELLVEARVLRFQITEVQVPKRERGREYKQRLTDSSVLVPYKPQRGMQEGPNWIAWGVKKKFDKKYSEKPHLVVYANFEAEDLDVSQVLRQSKPYKHAFRSLWVVQNHRLIQVWENEETRGWANVWIGLAGLQ